MNKNFKKIIATVAALAMASSSFVAMAATYPDVTPDAACYSAVEQLSALGIMEGFDDGTFKPEEKVTRAQMAKLVVGAKNLLASAESNTTVKFDDVPATHWAVGYVAEGVAQEIINGTSATTFDPDATVTFAQATKMLVNAAGYEEYAQIAGGWPNGYLTWGSTLGVNKGITGVGNDTELTRAQVAQMLINAMKAPILKIVEYYMDEGKRVPEYAQMDGERNKFESLLTDRWNTFEVYGRVTETSRSGAKKVGKVDYLIEKTDNYSDNEAGNPVYQNNVWTGTYSTISVTDAESVNSGAEDLYLEYTYALIQLDDDDEATIVYIEEAGKNKYVELTDELYVNGSYNETTDVLELFKSETSSSKKQYVIDDNVGLIVNGVFIPYDDTQVTEGGNTYYTTYDQATLEGYLSGSFENGYLIDSPTGWSASTDSKYDYIVIDTYETAVLEEVVTKNDGKSKVIFSNSTNGVASISVDPEDEDKEYSFVLTDGTELEVTDLKKNDVLSIKADPTNYAGSAFYEVIVSRDTVEGKVTGQGTDIDGFTPVYTVGDGEYKAVANLSPAFGMLKTYTLFLDKNGKVAKTELVASSINYAIVDRFFESAGDNKVRLIFKDGSKVDYALKADNTDLDGTGPNTTKLSDVMAEGSTYPLTGSGSVAIENRVVEYTVNSANEVTLSSTTHVVVPGTAQYNERTARIGSYGVSDTSIIINAADFATDPTKSVNIIDKTKLLNEMTYDAAFIGERNTSDGTYPMVVLLTDTSGYTTSSELMVAAGGIISITDDGETLSAIPVYAEDGTKTTLVLEAGATAVGAVTGTLTGNAPTATIVEGTPFVAKTNSAGKATEIWALLNPTTDFKHVTTVGSTDFTMLGKTTVGNAATAMVTEPGTGIDFNGETAIGADEVRFVIAPVVKKYDGGVALATDLGTPAANQSADAGVFFSYAADAKAYCYDGSVRNGAKVTVAESLALVAQSVVTSSGMVSGQPTVVDWASVNNTPAFAVARIYDNDIQEIYSIVLN